MFTVTNKEANYYWLCNWRWEQLVTYYITNVLQMHNTLKRHIDYEMLLK